MQNPGKMRVMCSIPRSINGSLSRSWRDLHILGIHNAAAAVPGSDPAGASPFREIDGAIDPYRSCAVRNDRHNSRAEREITETLNRIRQGGSKAAHERHTVKNKKLFVRDRLRKLLDPGSEEDYLEIAPFAGMGMEYGDIPASGSVSLIGRIHNKWCSVGCSDATVKGGTSYPITVRKQLRVQDIALQNRLPAIYGVDSGGAFLPLQAEIFPDKEHGGRIFYNEAILSSMGIPQIAVVCGSCTAGGAYVPTMAEEAVIIDKSGSIFLGGPPLVFAATGERVSTEDLGGATLHCKVSGGTDYFAGSEDEAWQLGRDIVATLEVIPPDDPTHWEEPLYDQQELRVLAPTPYDQGSNSVKKIIARIVDSSRMHEFKALYGPSLVAGFAFIKGHLVGVLATDDAITADAALKGAHFVSICQQRDIPLIFLQNVSSDDQFGGPEEAAEVLKARAKMMAVVAASTVPKITVIIGSSFGSQNYLMCGRSMDPNFMFSWPLAQIGMMAPEQLAASIKEVGKPTFIPCLTGVKHGTDVERRDKAKILWHDEQIILETGEPVSEAALISELQRKCSALYASGHLWDDGIILPHDTRRVLAQCLSIASQRKCWYKRETDDRFKFGVLRM